MNSWTNNTRLGAVLGQRLPLPVAEIVYQLSSPRDELIEVEFSCLLLFDVDFCIGRFPLGQMNCGSHHRNLLARNIFS